MGNLARWYSYKLGTTISRALLDGEHIGGGPVRKGTEADFKADEERFKKDEARIEAEIDAEKHQSHH